MDVRPAREEKIGASLAALATIAALLFALFGSPPHGYYGLLKVLVVGTSCYQALALWRTNRAYMALSLIQVAIGLLHAEVFGRLRRDEWEPWNWTAVATVAVSALLLQQLRWRIPKVRSFRLKPKLATAVGVTILAMALAFARWNMLPSVSESIRPTHANQEPGTTKPSGLHDETTKSLPRGAPGQNVTWKRAPGRQDHTVTIAIDGRKFDVKFDDEPSEADIMDAAEMIAKEAGTTTNSRNAFEQLIPKLTIRSPFTGKSFRAEFKTWPESQELLDAVLDIRFGETQGNVTNPKRPELWQVQGFGHSAWVCVSSAEVGRTAVLKTIASSSRQCEVIFDKDPTAEEIEEVAGALR